MPDTVCSTKWVCWSILKTQMQIWPSRSLQFNKKDKTSIRIITQGLKWSMYKLWLGQPNSCLGYLSLREKVAERSSNMAQKRLSTLLKKSIKCVWKKLIRSLGQEVELQRTLSFSEAWVSINRFASLGLSRIVRNQAGESECPADGPFYPSLDIALSLPRTRMPSHYLKAISLKRHRIRLACHISWSDCEKKQKRQN